MSNKDPDPPFVSYILEIILIVFLIYLLLYMLVNTILATNSKYFKMLLPSNCPNAITLFKYKTKQNVNALPFPKITDPPNFDFSLVVSIKNCQSIAYKLVQSIFNDVKLNCEKKGWTFEIVIVINNSNDKTLEEVSIFSESHNEIRIMNLPNRNTPLFCMTTGMLHTSGRLIMGYFPFHSKSTTLLHKYFDAIESLLIQSEQGLITGVFPIPKDQQKYLDTNFGRFISWITSLLFKCVKIKSSNAPLSQAVIMLRETAIKILPLMSESGDFAVSMLAGASAAGALIGTVEDIPTHPSSVSLAPIDRIVWLASAIAAITKAFFLMFANQLLIKK